MAINPKTHKDTMSRQVATYLHPFYHKLFIADCHSTLDKKSAKCAAIIKLFYDKMPEQERKALEKLYDEMTEEERKWPRR